MTQENQDTIVRKHYWPDGHPAVRCGRIGVLLINLGTPDATDFSSMRRYLREFLSDKRVIELPRILWYPILYGIVLNTRPRKSGRAYDKIWDKSANDSPLRLITRRQSEKLAAALPNEGTTEDTPEILVDWAMRYGNPPVKEKLNALKNAGCERLLIFPLYPQYCAATTASVNDSVFRALAAMRWQPSLRIVPPYFDDPAYIDALANSLQANLARLDFTPQRVIASFHGIPQSYFRKGDPYHCHCQKTARLLRERLGMDGKELIVTFQSRFGPEQWLQPYTDETLAKLARENIRKVAVFAPGFAADCVETLEEIAIEGRAGFVENGGESFAYLPCLNDGGHGITMIERIARRELSGWVD